MNGTRDRPLRIGLVGIGKIARDQHVPAIAASPAYEMTATASRNAGLPGIPGHEDIGAMLAAHPELDAVSICTPPVGRHRIAAAAIAAGKHVMIEKPPGATVAEVRALAEQAATAGLTLFATWHSREADGVAPARAWLAGRAVCRAAIAWREDIRVWHPGQEWIMAAGGFGVFDPGINALSIATAILPGALAVASARLDVPANRQSPIAADIRLTLDGAIPIGCTFDFLKTGAQLWDITVETDAGVLKLSDGGARLAIDGVEQYVATEGEYPRLYARFADLVARRAGDVDLRPLQLVADAFMLGERRQVAPFVF